MYIYPSIRHCLYSHETTYTTAQKKTLVLVIHNIMISKNRFLALAHTDWNWLC